MQYIRWTGVHGEFGPGRDGAELVEEWTEIRPDGYVAREIGFDANGSVAHLSPSEKYPAGQRGHFEFPIDPTNFEKIPAEEFDARWREAEQAAELLPPLPGPTGWRAIALVAVAIVFFALVIAYYTRGLWMH
jgi:hypothetical protein